MPGDGEPALADVQKEFRQFHVWRDTAGLCYAQLVSDPGSPCARGEDPVDLRDSIIRLLARRAEASASQ